MPIEHLLNTQKPFLADGGMETTFIFHDGIDLPHFASYVLLETDEGRAALTNYALKYWDIAKAAGRGFVLDTPTWRAGLHWTELMDTTDEAMLGINRFAAGFACAYKAKHQTEASPILVNGVIGPAGDGYAPEHLHSAEAAFGIHAPQVRALGAGGVDLVSGMTITYPAEAIGIVRAAREADLPVFIAFTVETDGRLPNGQSIEAAIAEVDAATNGYAMFFMINCAHPDHFSGQLVGDWTARIGGIRANASRMSHEELDNAEELDDGNPDEFGSLYADLARHLPNLKIIGGCCGTDHRHVGCASECLNHSHAA